MQSRFKLISALVALVLLLQPLAVLAQANVWDEYLANRHRYVEAREMYVDARQQYLDALQAYRAAAAAGWEDAMREPAREYLTRALHFMSEFTTVIRDAAASFQERGVFPFDAVGLLDGYLARFGELQAQVDAAQTRDDFAAIGQAIVDEWRTIQREVKYIFGLMVADRVRATLDDAHAVSDVLWADVARLQAHGVDTIHLEAALTNFDAQIAEAEAAWERARAAYYDTHEGFDSQGGVTNLAEADALLTQANEFLVEANRVIVAAHRALADALAAWEAQG